MAELIILSTDPDDPDPARRRRLIADARRGRLLRLTAGRYVLADAYRQATAHEQHRARIAAVLPGVAERLVVSHESAVALHDLPWLGTFPDTVTMTDPARTVGQRRAHLQKAAGAGRELQVMHLRGHAVTSLVVTAVDIALRAPFRSAVVVLDAVLARGVDRRVLLDELARRHPRPRSRSRARNAIEFAHAASGSPGETVCRLAFAELGFPAPVLQQRFEDDRGLIGFVDFWFSDQGVVVEFDGVVKYRDPAVRAGRSADEVVVDEKLREDRLRARPPVRSVVRLTWSDTTDLQRLSARLSGAGLPRRG